MRNQLKTLKQVEDHRARICLEMVCEYMRTRPEEESTKDVYLVGFQQWVGAKILSPNENQEYEKYRRKYREQKKIARLNDIDNGEKVKNNVLQIRTKKSESRSTGKMEEENGVVRTKKEKVKSRKR